MTKLETRLSMEKPIWKDDTDHYPAGEQGFQRNGEYSFRTAKSQVVIGKVGKKKVFSVIYIVNSQEGNGNASKLMDYIEPYAKQCKCKEIWYPTVLNLRLLQMLVKKGYKYQVHNDELFGGVEVWVKRLSK